MRARAVLLVPAGVALLAGLDAGLQMIDVPTPVDTSRLPHVHGMLMVLGFVGTLISLERAVALRRRPGFAAPLLLGLGGLLLVAPVPLLAGQAALVLGSAALVGTYVPLWRRQRDEAVLVQALGAVLATGAALLWLGGVAIPQAAPWLVGFVVLTIAGERLELARIAMGPAAGPALVLLSSLLAAAVAVALLLPALGSVLLGVSLLALTGWLVRHDVARRTVRGNGAVRFSALGMLAGYCWLAAAGATWLLRGAATSGAAYDTVLHAVFLGFTISMVMAHAPVILPAVLQRPLPYRPVLLAPLALLHASLVVRLWWGDALGSTTAWRAGAALNVAALLLFVGVAAWSATQGAADRSPARVPRKAAA